MSDLSVSQEAYPGELAHSHLHAIRDGRIVCSADTDSWCHTYPACDCEVFLAAVHGEAGKELPGHEPVQHKACGPASWINTYDDAAVVYDGPTDLDDSSVYRFPDGEVIVAFNGDDWNWEYVESDNAPILAGER